ncbi:hypothetical protein L2E82_22447 [Cichorium intybus]|uniref:Uncharacterized protein n=1 Tax=Cichorium intybus TaxID=13427 RepID=A0ACB9DY56_CICIN|nr:hypothetical protein L2E82_22447 [Cichorium intybus]
MAEITVSKPKQPWQVKERVRNWLELPSDVTANILYRIGVIDILENAQKVCTTWRKICKDPSMWRVIHMKKPYAVHQSQGPLDYINVVTFTNDRSLEICKHAVDQSQGHLVDICIVDFANDELL